MSIPWLEQNTPFPPIETALVEPNGLLAAGGDLSPQRLINAYENGIFPWYSEGEPILWWSPDPRAVIFPEKLHISRSLKRTLTKNWFSLAIDFDFEQTITQCARLRKKTGTWINQDMIDAYITLHKMGIAHSFEAWQGNKLVGGVYGLIIGCVFCGESMFSKVDNASKVALVHLAEYAKAHGINIIDCQVPNLHTASLGAETISRHEFITILKNGLQSKATTHPE
jgi:leucyl/phenylalanyl-tRNA--protein transferase